MEHLLHILNEAMKSMNVPKAVGMRYPYELINDVTNGVMMSCTSALTANKIPTALFSSFNLLFVHSLSLATSNSKLSFAGAALRADVGANTVDM